jgi:hypothetical protein
LIMEADAQVNAREGVSNALRRTPSRAKRPRSAVTSGRKLFVEGDPNSAWSRRFHDLVLGHVSDLGGADLLSEAQFSLVRRCAAIECELERLDARLSVGDPVDMDSYARVAGHLRRLFETLGVERVARDVTPTLGDLLRADLDAQRQATAEAIDASDGDRVSDTGVKENAHHGDDAASCDASCDEASEP